VEEHLTPRLKDWHLEATYAPSVDLPVLTQVDILVVGAGPAGVAAATVAGESGLDVLVIEKYGFAGGAAVAGLSGTICGMYLASDTATEPEQIVYGFTERFRKNLVERAGLTPPQIYGKTWTSAHDPLKWSETADDLLQDAGVRIMYHAAVTGVIKDGDDYQGVVVESNAGRVVIHAKRIIDASGDGAVLARGGHPYRFGDEGQIQNPTMFFRLGGVHTDEFWNYYGADTICPQKVTDKLTAERDSGADLPRNKIWVFRTMQDDEILVNATRLIGSDGRMLNVIDPEDFTEAEILGRKQVRAYAKFFQENLPGCEQVHVLNTGVEAGVRQTRTIVGAETLTSDDVVSARKRPDGICRVPWPIELHDGEKPKLHWLIDDYYEVPYLALVPAEAENIIMAGRCLSAEHRALASARVTAQCFEYGHAAAVASIISLQDNIRYREIPGESVRHKMKENGSHL